MSTRNIHVNTASYTILVAGRENGVTWLDNFGETDDEKK